ncbi:hypothetical protein DINM_000363 [Dirofilaria immitis]|nr:hypothetical protein [Dirofilaria immitis]
MDSMASSFLHNFSGQLLSRMISFGINMYLLRRIDSDILGLVNVNLMLFYSTTIFLVREPFRKVFLANEIPLSIIVTHLWFEPIIYPLIAALLYLCVWLPFSIIPDTSLVPSYIAALSMFAFSAWLESFAEPYVILSLRFGMDAQYAFAQSFLVIAQRVFAFILIIGVPMSPVYAFCCAQYTFHYDLQILSSFCYTALCIYLLVSGIRSVVPHVRDFNMISLYPSFPKNRSLLGAFTIHSIFKQAITNAVFDAVDKLGSLVARIIFAPLEHSAYLYFSTCLRRATSAKDQIEINVKKGFSAMNNLLHIVIVVGANILRFYCFYIIIIAINGVTECFSMATMDEQELLSHGWFLFLSSPIQILLSSAFSYAVGAYGLILANIISMLMRIAYSTSEFLNCSSSPFLSCGNITFLSDFGGIDGIMHSAAHIAVGCSLFIFVVNYIYQSDVHVAKFLRDKSLNAHDD